MSSNQGKTPLPSKICIVCQEEYTPSTNAQKRCPKCMDNNKIDESQNNNNDSNSSIPPVSDLMETSDQFSDAIMDAISASGIVKVQIIKSDVKITIERVGGNVHER
jgi:hypothetical protein